MRLVIINVRSHSQRGFAMIAVVLLVVLIASYLIVRALNRTTSEVSNAREDRTMNALVQAKAALIAYAASTDGWQAYKGQTVQPGGLPCPDVNTDTGTSPGLCPGATTRIGRLPFATIGGDDLRDASGERLWYAVSSNFVKNSNNKINSDTQGLLQVSGATPASNVVAVVIAPGPPLPALGQDRTGAAGHYSASNYLEQYVTVGSDYTFASSVSPSSTFNDQLLIITQADLMAAVEPTVAARMERDVKPLLQVQFNLWNAGSPFPANFANPGPGASIDQYSGDSTQTSGLLPLTTTQTYPWISNSGSVSVVANTGQIRAGSVSCVVPAGPGSGWQCSFTLDPALITSSCGFNCIKLTSTISNPTIRVQGRASNAGLSYVQFPLVSQVANTANGTPYTPSNPTIGGIYLAADVGGSGTARYQATYTSWNCSTSSSRVGGFPPPPSPCSPGVNMTVTIPDLASSPIVAAATGTPHVTGASNTTPITITTDVPHNYTSGYQVTLSGVTGNVAANGDWIITVTGPNSFALNGSSGNGIYISGGTAGLPAAWYFSNEWYRQTFYAVSPGSLPGGTGCCLTVNNYPSPNNNKLAILILAGRALNGSARPSTNLADYLEGENNSPGDGIFETRKGSPTWINDRVVVVSP